MAKSSNMQFSPMIEKGIPLPSARSTRSREQEQRINWPFERMQVGDSFVLPMHYSSKRVYAALSALKRRGSISKNLTVVTKVQDEFLRVWLIEQNAP